MKIGGVTVNYYIHCKRQCYLYFNRINLEDNSEQVAIGRVIHEERLKDKDGTEIQIEGVKIDKIKGQYLEEIKKSDSDVEAAKWQTLYYLYILKQKGIEKKGKIRFIEKKKEKKTMLVELNDENEKELIEILKNIEQLVSSDIPKEKLDNKNSCKKCAYYEYCYI